MATLSGFPASNLISPSVRIAEVDYSFIAPAQTGHNAGLVGFASKGPINIPTLVTSQQQLQAIFGNPHPDIGDPYLIYAAKQYLLVANALFVVRVADTSPVSNEAATTATATVLTAGGPVQIVGNIPAGSGWSFTNEAFFRWRLNGTLSSKVLVVLSNANRPAPYIGVPYAAADLVNDLNSQLSALFDGIQFYLVGSGNSALLGVETTFAYGPSASLELVSVSGQMYGLGSVVGMGTLMTAASITGAVTQYPTTSVPSPGTYNFSGFAAGTLNLQIVINGTDNILIDNIVQTVVLNSTNQNISSIVSTINNAITGGSIPGGFVASSVANSLQLTTLTYGEDSHIFIKPQSTADVLLGLGNITQVGTSPACVTAAGATYTCGIAAGSTNSSGTVCFTLQADSPGIDGNNTQIIITDHIADGNFDIQVFSYGSQVESWGNLTKDPTSSYYVESFLAAASNYIRVIDNTATLAQPASYSGSAPLSLSGGSDGIPSNPDHQDNLLIGHTMGVMTGLQAMSDPEQVDIDLIAIPGHTSTQVVLALLTFCQQTRQDCFAIIDSPFGLTVSEIVAWQNGTHPLNDIRFDSDFGALYWPWLMIADTFNVIDVWTPPSVTVLATYVNSDNLGAPWYAPAGTNRGLAINVLNAFSAPTLAERDQMYGNRNAVNTIITFSDLDGFYLWGQKTLQRLPSALDRVSVRRMLLYVEKAIKAASRSLLFEPNDSSLWTQFINIANITLSLVQSQRGLYAYQVQCDATLNTPDVVARNELRARVGVQPVYAAEFIYIEFAVFQQGSFAYPVNDLITGTF